jgi:hypothetical protein
MLSEVWPVACDRPYEAEASLQFSGGLVTNEILGKNVGSYLGSFDAGLRFASETQSYAQDDRGSRLCQAVACS